MCRSRSPPDPGNRQQPAALQGPYFVELGDFSLAGGLKITTKDEFHENFALVEGGSFDTKRHGLGAGDLASTASRSRRATPFGLRGGLQIFF